MSGADLYALCSDAMMAAIKRKMVSIEAGENRAESVGLLVLPALKRTLWDLLTEVSP